MSIKEKHLEWFTEGESNGNKAFLLGIERMASQEFDSNGSVFSTYLSRAEPVHFARAVTAITNVGWKLSSITNGNSEHSIFAVFTRASPVELARRDTKIPYKNGLAVFTRTLPRDEPDEFNRELRTIMDLEGELIGLADEGDGESVFAVFHPYLHDNFG